MAFAHETTRVSSGLGEQISIAAYALTQRIATYRNYRQTVKELSKLSTQELDDLGLHRGIIRHVAYETVYGG